MMKKMMVLLIVSMLLAACGTAGNSGQAPTGNNNENNSQGSGSGGGNSGDDGKEEDQSKEELRDGLKEEEGETGVMNGSVDKQDDAFLFTVENTSDAEVEILFSSGKEYDYVVIDKDGKVVKRLSEDMMYTQAIKELTLAPGEKLEYPIALEEVKAGLPAGDYSIEFLFEDATYQASASEEFSVE